MGSPYFKGFAKNKGLYALLITFGLLERIYMSFTHVGRVWIDEIWVVLNPAYRIVSGVGFLNPMDWVSPAIRSWFPPLIVVIPLKVFELLGVNNPEVVHVILTSGVSALTLLSALFLIKNLSAFYRIKFSLFAFIFILFTPEIIRHSLSFDLSNMAMPFLLCGLALWFSPNSKAKLLGAMSLSIASIIRYQFAVVPVVLFIFAVVTFVREFHTKKNKKSALNAALYIIIAAGIGLLLEAATNVYGYGYVYISAFSYILQNTLGGMAASYGVSPWHHGLEILWRFTTEPVFVLALVLFPMALKRKDEFAYATLALVALHLAVGHKEFRFFYGPAMLIAIFAGIQVSLYVQKVKPKSPYKYVLVLAFIMTSVWRTALKTDWASYDAPTQLVYAASAQKDLRGLIVLGWGGVKNPGQYSLHRPVPYEYFENRTQIKHAVLDPFEFSHILTPADLPPPCGAVAASLEGATLYRCSIDEIRGLFAGDDR